MSEERDRFGLSAEDWQRCSDAESLPQQGITFVGRLMQAMNRARLEIEDAHEVLDKAGITRGDDAPAPLLLGTRLALLAHQRDKANALAVRLATAAAAESAPEEQAHAQ